jgi:hyperosmotically inducible protein
MPKLFPLLSVALIAATALAACERPGNRTANLAALSDVESRDAAPARRVPDASSANAAEDTPGSTARAERHSREPLSDAAIDGRIKASIQRDPGMAGADVSVHTDRGVVNLTGTVKSQEQTAIASAHAQRQDGVMRIDNHLAMPPQ